MYDGYMYKNTVSGDAHERRTLIGVRRAHESAGDVEERVRKLTQQGVKALIFPDENLLRIWRQRLAALA